jgi:hypothetical protein
MVVLLTNPIECTTIFGWGDGDVLAAASAGCNGQRHGRTSTESFKLDVENEPSSEQEENDGVGDDPPCCWTFPVEPFDDLKELERLAENSRKPPSSGLSLPLFLAAATANFDGDGSVLFFLSSLADGVLGMYRL